MSSVRPFTVADAPAVAAVQVGTRRLDHAPHVPPGFWDGVTVEAQTGDWRPWPAQYPDDLLLVAEDAGEIAGYVLARCGPSHGTDAEVMALPVRPASRGQGHGRALLRAAVEDVQAAGARSVGLATLEGNPVRAWYGVLGGREVATREDDVDGWPVREVVWPDPGALLAALA